MAAASHSASASASPEGPQRREGRRLSNIWPARNGAQESSLRHAHLACPGPPPLLRLSGLGPFPDLLWSRSSFEISTGSRRHRLVGWTEALWLHSYEHFSSSHAQQRRIQGRRLSPQSLRPNHSCPLRGPIDAKINQSTMRVAVECRRGAGASSEPAGVLEPLARGELMEYMGGVLLLSASFPSPQQNGPQLPVARVGG